MRGALEKAKRALTMGADLAYKTETTDSQHRMADIVGAKLEMAESAVKAALIRWPNAKALARAGAENSTGGTDSQNGN